MSHRFKSAAGATVMVVVTLAIQGCGGGGGGDTSGETATPAGSEVPPVNGQSYTLQRPTPLSAVPALGTPSTTVLRTDHGTSTFQFPEEVSGAMKFRASTSQPDIWFLNAHLRDVVPSRAWQDGWTGKGVTVSVIDEFKNPIKQLGLNFDPVVRTKEATNGYGTYTADYSVGYTFSFDLIHGAFVSDIVGGNHQVDPTVWNTTFKVRSDTGPIAGTCIFTIRLTSSTSPLCASSFYEKSYLAGVSQGAKLRYQPYLGVAPEALMIKNQVNLSSSQTALQTVTYVYGHLANSASADVINLSLGTDIPTSGKSFGTVMDEIDDLPALSKSNAVITVAAGNGGAPCASSDLAGCNVVAVSLAFQSATKASTIVVGALSGSASAETIATYSTRAGILADRFILAPGETGYPDISGTSFAAPRVAGVAAILKQKYPSLTSSQIASVILLSANKDINNDGVDEFVGVHPIFGHGKLDLARALVLAGAL